MVSCVVLKYKDLDLWDTSLIQVYVLFFVTFLTTNDNLFLLEEICQNRRGQFFVIILLHVSIELSIGYVTFSVSKDYVEIETMQSIF